VNGPMKKKFLDATKSRRVHQIEEVYDMMYKDKVTEYLRSSVNQVSESEETTTADKSTRMAERRAARHECWENESEEVKEAVRKAVSEEKAKSRAQSANYAKNTSIESKSPAEIQE
jgi:hypothetical protein